MDSKTAILYVRVSTTGQAEEELPIDSQIERCTARARELGATILEVFRDDGRSGRFDNRPAFQAAMRFCEITPPGYLITWSTSRFFRNRIDAGLYKRRLDQLGIEIVYITTPIDRQTDAGWMMEGVMEIFDEWYSRQVSADTLRSMVKNARDGYWNGGTPPYGFRPLPAAENPKRKQLVIEEAETAIVREIFARRLQGNGAKHIAAALNQLGYANRGRRWNKTSILAVLRSEAVIGRTIFGRRDKGGRRIKPRDQWIIVETHPPIITIDQWETVQDLLGDSAPESGTGSPHSGWLFTGLLRCGSCGASMQIESAKGRSKRYHYYNCRQNQRAGACRPRRLPAEYLDQWLAEAIADVVLAPGALQEVIEDLEIRCSSWAKDNAGRRQAAVAQIEALQRKQGKLYELLEAFGKDTPNLADLTQRLREHKTNIQALEGKLAEIDAERPPALLHVEQSAEDLSATLKEIILTANDNKKLRTFFQTFINAIWIDGADARIEYRPEVILRRPTLQAVHSTRKWLPERSLLRTKTIKLPLPHRLVVGAGARGG